MSLILVIEQEGPYTERIKGALTAEGWAVQVVSSREAAMVAAANRAPDLVLVSTDTPGAVDVLQSFARRSGGPGAMALTHAGQGPPADADGALAKPFTDEQLRMSVRRCLSRAQKSSAEAAAARAASVGAQLTSQDLFGDLLAEVEEEASRPVRPAPSRAVDLDRKLEETLSGVLDAQRGPKTPKPMASSPAVESPAIAAAPNAGAAAATAASQGVANVAPLSPAGMSSPAGPAAPPATVAPRPPATKPRTTDLSASDDVESLLTQTLSGLGVGTRPKRAATAAPSAAPATPAAAPTAPSAAAVASSAAPAAPPAAQKPAPAVSSPSIAAPVAAPAASRPEPSVATPSPPRREPPAVEPPAADSRVVEAPRPEPPRGRRVTDRLAPAPSSAPSSSPAPAGGFATVRVETTRPAAAADQFGQYTLLERVALGGMAEVWKARMQGVEGFQKTVAIKKILPHLTDSVDFVTMFIDEAKLAAQLNHPNIIHIYDLGKLGDDYYIAMEYVEGKDLRSILNTARSRDMPLPAGLAMHVAARLASALDHAHRKRDFDNRELGLVHRDVSPQNVLIGYEGEIKLCDFGIVKAVAKASKTQMGALKGKLQYMSPEQAWGRVVDGRSDIFSLGTVLFEMLTGRRLFAGESEISVLESVRDCRIQSAREVDAGISEPIDAIVRRALAKDPDDRYQTAGQMQKEIEAVLYSYKPTPGQGEVATYMRRLYSEELGPVSGKVQLAAVAAAVPGTGAEMPAVAPVGGLQPEEGSRRRAWFLAAAAALVLTLGGGVLWFTRGGSTPAPPPAPAPASAPATGEPAPPTAAAAVPAAVPGNPADMQRRLNQDLQAKEEQLKRQLEEQRRQIAAELKAQPAPSAVRPTPTQVAAATAPQPAPAPTRAEVEKSPPVVPAPAPTIVAAPPLEPAEPAPTEAEPAPAAPKVQEGDFVAPGTPGLSPPAFVGVEKPEYPALAKRLGVQGVVVVSVLVNEQGSVEQTRLVRGVAQKVGLNEAALAAARSARYRPATLDGVRVKTWANLSIPFKM